MPIGGASILICLLLPDSPKFAEHQSLVAAQQGMAVSTEKSDSCHWQLAVHLLRHSWLTALMQCYNTAG